MKRTCLLLCVLFVLAGNVFSGPFGLSKGMTLKELQAIDPSMMVVNSYQYGMFTVPVPSARFRLYLVEVHPEKGLFAIGAAGVNIQTTPHGTALMSAYNSLLEAISKAYPTVKPESVNYLERGSIWNEPEDFMTALYKKERTVYVKWGQTETNPTVNEEIELIFITASASKKDSGSILLGYRFTDYDEISKSLKPKENF